MGLLLSPDSRFRVQFWWIGPPKGRLHWVNTAALAGGLPIDHWGRGWVARSASTNQCSPSSGGWLQGSDGSKIVCLLEPRVFLRTTDWWSWGGGTTNQRDTGLCGSPAGDNMCTMTRLGVLRGSATCHDEMEMPPAGYNYLFCARLWGCESWTTWLYELGRQQQ